MKKLLILALLLLTPSLALAQAGGPAPLAATTVKLTDTSATALCVGCALGSSTASGGIKAGDINGTGLLTMSGFGETNLTGGGTGSQLLHVENTTSGFASYARVETFAGTTQGSLSAYSQGFTGTAWAPASGVAITSNGTLGLTLQASDAAGAIKFYVGGTTLGAQLSNAGILSVNGYGQHSFVASGTGTNQILVQASSAGTTNLAAFRLGTDASATMLNIEAYSSTFTPATYKAASGGAITVEGSGGLSIAANHASGVIRFYTGGTTLRWGYNAAGDHIFGTSSHIADSSGTPVASVCTGGGTTCTWTGTDYAILLTTTAGPTVASMTFGHTWTTAPICAASTNSATLGVWINTVSTTGLQINPTGASLPTSVYILCRGY